ncbi:hypothetical protein PybrP1_004192 [[Pythium] brassicae (nom. inval.)]|nr:hypothetical protein PybrP1_004192 [[Pythium] brassicae (nom. inval.)]
MRGGWQVGRHVTLVPYEKEHVAKYHEWMKDPWLQEMTASEPLSMEEEYEMQRSWREDEKKCTFIVLAKGANDADASFTDDDAISRMAGDVNLFFNDYEDAFNCEMEIMIAEPKYRRSGFAREAVELMMAYATSRLHVRRFYCKINEANDASLQLFDRLGYKKCNYVTAFQELELELLPAQHTARVVDDVLAYAEIRTLEAK